MKTYDIAINNGATFELPINYKDKNAAGIDMTDFKIRMQSRKSIKSPTFEIALTTENGRIVYVNRAQGQFKLLLSASDTASLVDGVYDIEIENSGGQVIRLMNGNVACSPEVTR